MPWWVSILLSCTTFVSLKIIFPSITLDDTILSGISRGLQSAAIPLSLILLIPAPFALLNQFKKKKLIRTQKSLDEIKVLDWKSFEDLVGEAFRQSGYKVEDNTVKGADGGIDLWLRKDGQRYIAQCKRWKNKKVSVSVVREMYGLMISENASGVFIITSGKFTTEATQFARLKPVYLINGSELVDLISRIQSSNSEEQTQPTPTNTQQSLDETVERACPKCGLEMKLRVARRGPNIGNKFWGCSNYPKCRHTMSLEQVD
jgi:restriction system protein